MGWVFHESHFGKCWNLMFRKLGHIAMKDFQKGTVFFRGLLWLPHWLRCRRMSAVVKEGIAESQVGLPKSLLSPPPSVIPTRDSTIFTTSSPYWRVSWIGSHCCNQEWSLCSGVWEEERKRLWIVVLQVKYKILSPFLRFPVVFPNSSISLTVTYFSLHYSAP